MKTRNLMLIPLLFVVLLGCSKKSSTEDPVVVPDLFPLKTGNTWTYKTTRMDTVISSHFNKVIGDTIILGETWSRVSYDDALVSIMKNKSDGLWFMNPTKSTSGIAILYYKYPVPAGTQYVTTDGVNVTVVSVNETVTVPMGTFSCYHYTMTYPNSEVYQEYYCPGKGLVRMDKFAVNGGISVLKEKVELVSAVLY